MSRIGSRFNLGKNVVLAKTSISVTAGEIRVFGYADSMGADRSTLRLGDGKY